MPTPIPQSSDSIHSLLLRWLVLNRRGLATVTLQDQGLTLIECLVAIVIIALTVVSITPPIMIATGSRVQARKADVANQIAQAEIDRIRSLVERGTYIVTDLPASVGANVINAANAPAPNQEPSSSPTANSPLQSSALCGRSATPASATANDAYYPRVGSPTVLDARRLVQVDVNGDCIPEYAMQVFRTDGYTPVGETIPFSFTVGVRVYPYTRGQTLLPLAIDQRASLVMGTGARENTAGGRRPMAVLQTQLARNDSSKSLGQICLQSGGNTGKCKF